jgi:hypothetical protein
MSQSHVKSCLHTISLPTPIKVNKLEHFLQGYDCDVKNKLIQRFSFGFKINSVIEKADQKFPNNHRSARKNPEVVVQNINKEILKGRIRGPFKHPPFDNFICFPLGLVPKEESGSFRLIRDFSFPKGGSVNFWTPPEYTLVSYQNIETVIELVQENGFKCLMSKADIQGCFPSYSNTSNRVSFIRFSMGWSILS